MKRRIQINTLEVRGGRDTTYLICHDLRLEKNKELLDLFYNERRGNRSVACGSIIGK